MRHRVAKKKLSRDVGHRKALLKNLSGSLIEHESIETTLAKAKALRPYVEKLVTKARKGSEYNILRYLRTKLLSENAIRKLVTEIAPKYKDRQGGYTRIIRTRNRDGDDSTMARIEFVQVKTKKSVKEGTGGAPSKKSKEVTNSKKTAEKSKDTVKNR